MSLQEFISLLTNVVYVLLGVLSVIGYLRHRDPIRLSIALLFGSVGLLIVLSRINVALPERQNWLTLAGQLLFTAHPYLLVRLVKLFRPVPRRIERAALVGLFISWGMEIFIGNPLPPPVVMVIALYMVFFELYGAYAFLDGALTTRGVTRWRMSLAAIGSASLGAILFLAGLFAVFPDVRDSALVASQPLAITSGVSYYLGFATPRWLRQALQNTELYYYLHENAKYPLESRASETLNILRRAALQAIGGRAALIAENDPRGNRLVLRATGQYKALALEETLNSAASPLGRVWQQRKPIVLHDLSPQEAALASEFGADTIFIVPIAASEKIWGLLLVFAYGKPIFAEDELALLALFAEQSAITLDYAAVVIQLEEYAEKLKQTHEDELSRFFRLSNNLISITGFDGSLKMINPAWKRALGYTAGEIAERGIPGLVHPDDLKETREKMDQLTQGIELSGFENRYVGKDGKARWLSWNSTPVMETQTIYAVAHDITELKENQEALRKSEEQLRLITDSVPALIAYLSRDMRYQFANKTYQDWFGLEPEYLIGKTIQEVFGKEVYETSKLYTDKALAGERVTYEIAIPDSKGKPRYMSVSYIPDTAISGKVTGYFMLATDLTERKQAEEAIYQHSERLRILSETSRLLAEATTDYQRLLDSVVRLLAEQIGDSCLIRLPSKDGQWLEPVAYHDPSPEHFVLVSEVLKQNPLSVNDPYIAGMFQSIEPVLITREQLSTLKGRLAPTFAELIDRIQMKSMLVAPLRVEGRTIGLMYLSRQDATLPEYSAEDVLLVRNLADRIAMAVRNAQLLRDLQTAVREKDEVLALLDTLFSSAPVGLAFFDREIRFQRINKALAQINGLPIEAHIGRTPKELLPNVEVQGTEEMFLQVLATGEPVEFESSGTTFADSSRTHYWLASYYPVKLHGEILGIGAVMVDITERKEMEQELRASEQHLRNVLDSLFAYVGVMTPDGILIEANKTALQSAALNLDDVLGKPFEETYWWSHSLEVQKQLRAAINRAARGEPSRYDADIRLAADRFITIDFMLAPMFDSEGNVTYLIPSGIDITERRQAEEELKNTARKLEESNIELQNFAYIASHDLQEPLRKVQAFGDRLSMKYKDVLDDQGQDYLERMQSAARRMQTLIQDLLVYSRLSSQVRPFVLIDLNQLVQEVLSDLEVRIRETSAVVHVDELAMIEGDPTQMQQLLQNLVSNALKYHRPDIPPEIRISGQQRDGRLYELRVEDNGIGFDEKYVPRIFGFFQRLHGRTEYEGTGMGLAICKKIVERHSGEITAHSIEGQGSTFIVTLPMKQRKGKNFGRQQPQPTGYLDGRR